MTDKQKDAYKFLIISIVMVKEKGKKVRGGGEGLKKEEISPY